MTTRPDVTLTFTADELSTLTGALNTASLARAREAKRCRKNVGRAGACEALAKDYDQMFCVLVRARQAAQAQAARWQAEGDADTTVTP
jgi:hypothetical protein